MSPRHWSLWLGMSILANWAAPPISRQPISTGATSEMRLWAKAIWYPAKMTAMVTTALAAMFRLLLMVEKNLQTAPFSTLASCAQADEGTRAHMATTATLWTSHPPP